MKHLAVILMLALVPSVQAGEGHEHAHSHEHIVIPATLAEVRSAISAKQSELAAALAARDADKAHGVTDFLVAYVKAIPGVMGTVDEVTKQRAEGMANNAAKAWQTTVEKAEHGDFDQANAEATKAAAAFKLLEARLPKD
jgi:hypothetical protein